MNSRKVNKFALMCAASVVALTAGARAQQQNVETVTVTGSRVISDITLSPTPITAVSAEQLITTTPSTIPDALNKLPDFYGSQTARNQGNGSGNGSSNALNLRNLGASRTLVLFDGQRVAPANQGGTVNVDTLPQMLVSRVDIVTGGASAVYGSDAVAGVVNFILDKKFTGFKYDINAGISKYGDAAEERIGFAWGTELFGGRGHYEMSVRVFQQDMIPIAARPYGYQGNAWVQPGSGTAADPFVDVPYGRLFNQSLTGTIKCSIVPTAGPCSLQNYTFKDGNLVPMTHGIPTTLAGLESGGDGGYADPVDTTYQARQRQGEFFNRFSYDITDHVNAYVQASASESADYSRWTPLLVSAAGSRPNTFFTNNAYLSAQQQQQLTAAATAAGNFMPAPKLFTPPTGGASSIAPAVPANTPFFSDAHYINKVDGQHAYLGDNIYATKGLARNLSVTVGLDGDFSGFAWRTFYSHQDSRVTVVDPQNTNNAKWMAAQDAVIAPAGLKVNGVDVGGSVQCWVTTQAQFAPLYPGCVPANVFDSNGISQAAYNYIKQATYWSLTQELDNLGGSISGGLFGLGLPAGEITGALSAEMRWRTYFNKTNALPTDFVNCTGLRMCTVNGGAAPALWTQNVNAPQDSSDNVWETALEFNIPVLKDFPLAEDLNVDVAGRHTSYSISGDADSWKIGINDRINETFRLRGTMSYDIRAPNLNDLFQPVGISSTGFNDLLTKANNSTQLVQQGNAGLRPEVAHTYTLGLVLTPDFIPGFVTSLDYYQTHMSDAITQISYQNTTVQNLCIASAPTNYNSPFCALAVRPIAAGQPGFTSTANYPTQVLSSPVNSAKIQMEGWNFEVDYNFELADVWDAIPGSINLRHLLSYTPVLQQQNLPGTAYQWGLGGGTGPKTRMTTFISYEVGDWGVDIQNRWLSGWKKATLPGQIYTVPRITSNNVMDITINRRFDMWGGSSSLYFNVQNIGNTRAPLQGANASVPGLFYPSPTQYSDMGRYFTIGLKGNF